MDGKLILREKPSAETIYMIAGWRQWADAGSISSGLPKYLIQETGARKIGEITPDGFYIFQVPGTHHLLRPTVKLADGFRQSFERRKNEFYYAGDERVGLVIFLGDEPQFNAEEYVDLFLQATQDLNVKRVIGLGGVYGAIPYDRERQISCVYSLPHMKSELEDYAVRFSDYEGGATIGTFIVDQAEDWHVEMIDFYAFVPAYNFSQASLETQGISVENDFGAWHDLMRRVNHMLGLSLDLSGLQRLNDELIATLDEKVAELEDAIPQFDIRTYLENLETEFTEEPFMPLGDVWDDELEDLFREGDE